MRLFQSQTLYDENHSPPPPPHFSLEREATRIMPVYLNQYRDGRHRLPTPEKVAVMELSGSFERRRLGKHQQMLCDITHRCREQEVSDLSHCMSAKLNLQKYDKHGRELTFYTTNFMEQRKRKAAKTFPDSNGDSKRKSISIDVLTESSKPTLEKSYKHFPARSIMRQQTKFDFLKPTLPLVSIPIAKPPAIMDPHSSTRFRLAGKQRTNGRIQLNNYVSQRQDMAPLVIPSFNGYHSPTASVTEKLDRMDTYFSTNRLVLEQREKSNLNSVGKTGANDAPQHPLKQIKIQNYCAEMSQLQMTSGRSTNSELEAGAATV